MSDLKNIVIIGASIAGVELVRSIQKKIPSTHRLVVVDARTFQFHPVSSLRSAVLPGHESRTAFASDPSKFFPAGSPHVFLDGTSVVQLAADHVEVEGGRATEILGSSTIPYDFAVLATGSLYVAPARPTSDTLEGTLEGFKKYQADIRTAKSILVLGGGPVGVELAGEVKEVYPSKKVTLLTTSAGLIGPKWAGIAGRLEPQLAKTGVKVIKEDSVDIGDHQTGPLSELTKFTTARGETVEADYIFIAYGAKPNSGLLAEADPSAVQSNGSAKIDDFYRVQSTVLPRLFAIGDITGSGTIVDIKMAQVGPVGTNLLAAVAAGDAQKGAVKKVGGAPSILLVSYGKNGGAGQLPLPIFGTQGAWVTSLIKSKGLFIDDFHKSYISA